MTTWRESSKLVELRTKTDRELLELVARMLVTAASLADSPEHRARARTLCGDAGRLAPFLPRADRRRVESRIAEIQARIDPVAHAACF